MKTCVKCRRDISKDSFYESFIVVDEGVGIKILIYTDSEDKGLCINCMVDTIIKNYFNQGKFIDKYFEEKCFESKDFTLDKKQFNEVQNWMKEHKCKFKSQWDLGAIGGRFTYQFTPTSLGAICKVKCACGKEIDVTHSEDW